MNNNTKTKATTQAAPVKRRAASLIRMSVAEERIAIAETALKLAHSGDSIIQLKEADGDIHEIRTWSQDRHGPFNDLAVSYGPNGTKHTSTLEVTRGNEKLFAAIIDEIERSRAKCISTQGMEIALHVNDFPLTILQEALIKASPAFRQHNTDFLLRTLQI